MVAITLEKNGKASGPDDMPADFMKAARDVSIEVIHPF